MHPICVHRLVVKARQKSVQAYKEWCKAEGKTPSAGDEDILDTIVALEIADIDEELEFNEELHSQVLSKTIQEVKLQLEIESTWPSKPGEKKERKVPTVALLEYWRKNNRGMDPAND